MEILASIAIRTNSLEKILFTRFCLIIVRKMDLSLEFMLSMGKRTLFIKKIRHSFKI
jgi:hypothetical protein